MQFLKKGKILEFIEVQQWHQELNVSLLGNYLIIKYFVEFLKKINQVLL